MFSIVENQPNQGNPDEGEYDNVVALNAWLDERGCGQLQRVNEHIHGKGLDMQVYAAGLNYLVLDDFLAEIKRLTWEDPGRVRLITSYENDEQPVSWLLSPKIDIIKVAGLIGIIGGKGSYY